MDQIVKAVPPEADQDELFGQVRTIANNVLQLGIPLDSIDIDAPLLGHIPELDSMAVVTILTSFEESFDIVIEDDEITADVFASWRMLVDFVRQKLER